jgi:AcrR family transcriptional regulator
MSEAIHLTKPVKSWTRRKQARPGEILEAALSVFAEKGYAAARMEDIAAKAGVTKGTIYLYFQNKEDVFKSLAREIVGGKLSSVIQQVNDYTGPARELLLQLLRTINAFLSDRERAMLPKIIIAESGNFPELARFWRKEVIDKALATLTQVIKRGIEKGEFRPVDAEYTVKLCVAPIMLSVIWRDTFSALDSVPLDNEKFLALHFDILLKGLAPQGAAP